MNKIVLLGLMLSAEAAMAATSQLCPGQEGYYYTNYRQRNPQIGGFVAHTAFVDDNDNLFLAPTAAVCDSAQLLGTPKVLGKAVVRGNSEVSGSATLKGNVIIEGDSRISEEATIQDNVRVSNSSVSGKALIKGNAIIESDSDISDNAKIQDNVRVSGSNISGTTSLKGWFKAINTTLTSGEHFGPQYSDSEIEAQRAEAERQRLFQLKLTNLRNDLAQILKSEVALLYGTYDNGTSESTKGRALVSLAGSPCDFTIISALEDENSDDDYARIEKNFSTTNFGKSVTFTNSYIDTDVVINEGHVRDTINFYLKLRESHPNYVSTYNHYSPSLVISTSAISFDPEYNNSYYQKQLSAIGVSEKLFTRMAYGTNVKAAIAFSSLSQRDAFANKVKELYNACPSR